ncbi:hypothetical protein JVT61DRAFT_697 [Boletus reticuloceps]|uniref:Sld7 C-terminal domain-containing protein n=1 Tax=Boletus reticuloceps TaxID=495285 RepID=A0A8I2Z071_9AGAM|nr:hypothetical protein JVT61DRAFT_697 [Boletus reticuloceps]
MPHPKRHPTHSLSPHYLPPPRPSPPTPAPVKGTDVPYRLLYRGALSLPDSYLLLDGIAFSARLPNRPSSVLQDSPSCSLSRSDASTRELMYNPLPLALESMRGRQSLRFKGTVRLPDVYMDDTGDVYMDVHPCATLTRIYFENTLCLSSLVVPPHGACGPRRTEVGVRVSLGDTDGLETTDIVIYGEASTLLYPPPMQLSPAAASSSAGPPPLSMRVARIMPAPRAPRPDDPTPRQPPTRLFGDTTLSDLGANKRIVARPTVGKAKEKTKVDDHVLRRAREVMLHLPRSEGSANGSVKEKAKEKSVRDSGFKVPEIPAKARRKQGGTGTDVFGAVEPPRPRSVHEKVLKKLSVLHLANAGIPRSHDEFKDVFGFVYRGAAFALRSQLKTRHISALAAEAVVEAHVKLYVATYDPANLLHTKTSLSTMDVDDAGSY